MCVDSYAAAIAVALSVYDMEDKRSEYAMYPHLFKLLCACLAIGLAAALLGVDFYFS